MIGGGAHGDMGKDNIDVDDDDEVLRGGDGGGGGAVARIPR